MDSFEAVVAMLLRREGYWVIPNFKVVLTPEDKRAIGKPSSPRWEIDLVAYEGATNKLIAVECKSFLDSRGVVFKEGALHRANTYKLFNDKPLRDVVLKCLVKQLVKSKSCHPRPTISLALATGKIAKITDRDEMIAYFKAQNWILYDDHWIHKKLSELQNTGYEDDVAVVAAKLALRGRVGEDII